MTLTGQRVLITGGTGSLGRSLVGRIMDGDFGDPEAVLIFSRDEDKQHAMELEWKRLSIATDDVHYYNAEEKLQFIIGDVRDYESVVKATRNVDIVIHAAAMKHVPIGEHHPFESIKTNILGTQNIIRAISESGSHRIHTMLVISTDKACKPVNTYGMCKALKERLTIEANRWIPDTRFICVRYGNVVASRGSIIPLFREQIDSGGPITVTDSRMTRYLITLRQATDLIHDAICTGKPGDIYVPILPSANVKDIAEVMIGDRDIEIRITGVRPGEKYHESLISEEEAPRSIRRGDHYVILPVLPKSRTAPATESVLTGEISSADDVMSKGQLKEFLQQGGFILGNSCSREGSVSLS